MTAHAIVIFILVGVVLVIAISYDNTLPQAIIGSVICVLLIMMIMVMLQTVTETREYVYEPQHKIVGEDIKMISPTKYAIRTEQYGETILKEIDVTDIVLGDVNEVQQRCWKIVKFHKIIFKEPKEKEGCYEYDFRIVLTPNMKITKVH